MIPRQVMKRYVTALLVASVIISVTIPLSGFASAEIDADFLGSSPGRFNSIKVLDIDEDGKVEIVFGNYEGHLNVLETTGGSYIEEWRSESLGTRLCGVEVGDVDGDDVNEIVTGNGEGYVYVYDAVTHKLEWKSGELVRDAHGIAIGDVDGDGDNDLVIGTGYKTDTPWSNVYIFDGKTKDPIGTIGPFDSRIRSIAISDIDRDGSNEILFGSGVALGETAGEGYIYIYGYDSGIFLREWKSDDLNGDVNGLLVYDIEGDNELEIVASNGYRYTPGYVYMFRYRGFGGVGTPQTYEQLWVSEDIGPKAYGLAVGDVDDDGITEIVVGNQPGYIWIFDAVNRLVEWKSELLGTDILGIALSDLDLDGQMEIIAAQGGYQGKADFTSAYTTPHLFIINGKTHAIESKLGEPDFIAWGFQIVIVILIIVLLIGLNSYFRMRKKMSKTAEPLEGEAPDEPREGKEVVK
jgi:hypothetical protein